MIEDIITSKIEHVEHNLERAQTFLREAELRMKEAQEEVNNCNVSLVKLTEELDEYRAYLTYKNT